MKGNLLSLRYIILFSALFNLTDTFKWARRQQWGLVDRYLMAVLGFLYTGDRGSLDQRKEIQVPLVVQCLGICLPANAGDMGLIHCLKGSHMPWSN